jgi:PPM family protein phosphatase
MTVGRATGLSHPGRRRRRNEDSWVCDPPLFAVADGMGGARGGEIASKLAASALGAEAGGSGEERVAALIQEANRRVYERGAEDSSASGMGTTITVALVEDGEVAIGHVGDSRAYLIREDEIEQLTDDHSLVAELVRSGKLSPEEAETHPQRSVITRALGTDPDVDVDTFSVPAQPGDLFMICSDGLTSMVGDETIMNVLRRRRDDLDAAAKELVLNANRSGGEDNITVVFFEISDAPAEPAPDETAPLEPVAQVADEDTLSGLEGLKVPDETGPVPGTEQVPRGRGRGLLVLLLVVLALLAAAAGLYWALYL